MSVPFERRILHHGSSPGGTPVLISNRAVNGCWFELLRQGGCGAGEVELSSPFDDPHDIVPGDWISCEYAAGDRWYLGRVEEVQSLLPAGRRLRLEGMSIELNEIFPGGFGESADGAKPHRYAATDMFVHDPDRALETADSIADIPELLQLVLNQYVVTRSHIAIDSNQIDVISQSGDVVSLKFHGEESVRSIVKDLAVRARGASWGVDANGKFFFLAPRSAVAATYREGLNITTLTEQRTREQIFNRILLTGDYVYDRRDASGDIARRSYRWRANFQQPESRSQFGERRIRLWIPWIRTQVDARTFAREFFRTYALANRSYLVETLPQSQLPAPWLGVIRLVNRQGLELGRGQVEAIRVKFDQAPSFRLEIGPIDPRQLWPEPPHDERWELPDDVPPNGGDVSVTQDPPGNSAQNSGSSGSLPSLSSNNSSSFTSILSSVLSSNLSSIISSHDNSSSDPAGSSLSSAGSASGSSALPPSASSAYSSGSPSSIFSSSAGAGSSAFSSGQSSALFSSSGFISSQDHSDPDSSGTGSNGSGGGTGGSGLESGIGSGNSGGSSSFGSGNSNPTSYWTLSSGASSATSWSSEFSGSSSSLGGGPATSSNPPPSTSAP